MTCQFISFSAMHRPHVSNEAPDPYISLSPTSPTAHYLSQGHSSCPRPVPRPYNSSITSTSLHPTFMTKSATYFMGGNTGNVCQTFKPMTRRGLLTIWTGYVARSLTPALRLSQSRLSMVSILQVPHSGSVYANSEAYAALGGYSQHRTRFRLTF